MTAITSDHVEINCTPSDGILALSVDTIAALDELALTLIDGDPWQIDVAVGWTAHRTIHLTARAATGQQDAA